MFCIRIWLANFCIRTLSGDLKTRLRLRPTIGRRRHRSGHNGRMASWRVKIVLSLSPTLSFPTIVCFRSSESCVCASFRQWLVCSIQNSAVTLPVALSSRVIMYDVHLNRIWHEPCDFKAFLQFFFRYWFARTVTRIITNNTVTQSFSCFLHSYLKLWFCRFFFFLLPFSEMVLICKFSHAVFVFDAIVLDDFLNCRAPDKSGRASGA